MTPAQPPRIISVLHAAEESGTHPQTEYNDKRSLTGTTWHECEETFYYAILQPTDAWDRWNEGEEPAAVPQLLGGADYAVFGGQPVHIFSQADIDGLRKLLDAIEADLKEGAR